MATLRAFLGTKNFDIDVFYGEILKADSREIIVSDGFNTAFYTGNFSYTFDGRVNGTLRGYEQSFLGIRVTKLSDFAINANIVQRAVEADIVDPLFEIAQSGADNLFGSNAGDSLRGFGGPDYISGGGGADLLLGDRGSDRIDGGQGSDRIDGGVGKDTLSGDEGADTIDGGGRGDVVDGGAGNDHVYGGLGNDEVSGGDGHDYLDGGGRGDRIFGGAGDDFIRSGPGRDVVTGGTGRDTFYFSRGDGSSNTVTDYDDAADWIAIGRGASNFADLNIQQKGSDTKIKFSGVSITLEDTRVAELDSADFLF